MTVLLLDASVWLAAFDPRDPYHDAASTLVALGPGARDLAALDLTLFEVANVALTKWRSLDVARRVVEHVEIASGAHLERVDGETICATASKADEHGLTAYDAAYLMVAWRHGWTLVSCDMKDLVRPGHAITPEDVIALSN